jgi:hypothetical protein
LTSSKQYKDGMFSCFHWLSSTLLLFLATIITRHIKCYNYLSNYQYVLIFFFWNTCTKKIMTLCSLLYSHSSL